MTDYTEIPALLSLDAPHASGNNAFLYNSDGQVYPLGPCGIPADRVLYLKHRGCVLKTLRIPHTFSLPEDVKSIDVDKSDDLYVYGGIQRFQKIDCLGSVDWLMILVEPPRPWPEETTEAYGQYRDAFNLTQIAFREAHAGLLELGDHNPLAKRDTPHELLNGAISRMTQFKTRMREFDTEEEPPLKRLRRDKGDSL